MATKLSEPTLKSVEVRVVQDGRPDLIYQREYAGLTPREAFLRFADEESLVMLQQGPLEINSIPCGIDAAAVLEHGDVFRISGVVVKLS